MFCKISCVQTDQVTATNSVEMNGLNLLCEIKIYLSLVVRKSVFGVSDQVRHTLGCTATEDG